MRGALGWMSVFGSGAQASGAVLLAVQTIDTRAAVIAALAFLTGCGMAARALFSAAPGATVDVPIPDAIKKPGAL